MTLEQARRELYPSFTDAMDIVRSGTKVAPFIDSYLNDLLKNYADGTSRRQIIISFTKWMHGFNLIDPNKDFAYMVKEVSEALEAHAEGNDDNAVTELADVVIYCYGIAQMLGFDLEKHISSKMEYNLQRDYDNS